MSDQLIKIEFLFDSEPYHPWDANTSQEGNLDTIL
jgi:hypothetical protein